MLELFDETHVDPSGKVLLEIDKIIRVRSVSS